MLAPVKGDKVVKVAEICPDLLLFFLFRQVDRCFFAVFNSVSSYRSDTCRLVNEGLNCFSGERIKQKISVNFSAVLKPYDIAIFEV